MHLFPQLRKLEEKYREQLAVIGVHSAKFTSERETANVRNAILRHDVRHPVINDPDFAVWQAWGVRAWPTLMFVDPRRQVIGKHEGELPYEEFDRLISDMTGEFQRAGLLDPTPLQFQLEADTESSTPLRFPGKVEADAERGRLFIADSNHNRVLVTDLKGRSQELIGSGDPGMEDGDLESASFWRPQGMALTPDGRTLYVADAENHAVRQVDLRERSVTTIAGTGEQALYRHRGGDPLQHPLNSPYDLALQDGVLYIAMAGFHQLWALDFQENHIRSYAGNGRENIVDGRLEDAELAQPYGIVAAENLLYFADSETSAVRSAETGGREARVETLVGKGLFEFGDRDDAWTGALLQHVQGLALGDGPLYLADTYNHKIKRLSLATGHVETLAGCGRPGSQDGPALDASFDEPAGVSWAGGLVYVADTNNHRVRILDPEAQTVSTLEITGL